MADTARITGQDGEPDIACQLGDEAGTQEERWMRLGRVAGLGRTETEDGLRVRFRGEPAVEAELRALVAVENECCSWARWEVSRAGGELLMQVRSTPEGAAALHAMFSPGPTAGPGPSGSLAAWRDAESARAGGEPPRG